MKNILNKFGAMNMILYIIQENGKILNKGIMIKVISFGNSLLKGGNKVI